ncbi:hypothetical protein ACFFF5_14590 [Lederbergia wuyishanensis]|uniref:Uncharacterized protein n=1 Tax=Lederbergia wuyishanensis TaxID=1347903 RepID=A0ABU0D9S1_9BACI|nr:hypothetical protein [Lederbergia wuyishanensis]MCJ8007406.1 hypothetical protein [Lederbergia wuyishanensis]MDQ0345156.1 hypothetical protein [Lederbergia wuyishanensis]
MKPLPIDGKAFWIKVKGLDIEIFCTVHDDHVLSFATYYYYDEDSFDGMHEEPILGRKGVIPSVNAAINGSVTNLFKEMKKQGFKVWQAENPNTKQTATINFFGPVKK